jgi:hypothetical protein
MEIECQESYVVFKYHIIPFYFNILQHILLSR